MKKLYLFFFSLILISIQSNAQQLTWSDTIEYGEVNTIQGITTDDFGSLYAFGQWVSGLSGGGALSRGIFIHKYNSAGILQWSDSLMSWGISANSVQIIDNELFLVGNCIGSIDQNLNFGSFNLFKPASSNRSMYISKLDLNGNVLLSKIYLNASVLNVEIFENEIYICGSSWNANYDGFSCVVNENSLTKFSTSCICTSLKCLGNIEVQDMEVYNENNIFLGLGNGSSSSRSVSKYDSLGNFYWNTYIPGSIYSIDSDSTGNCYVSGSNGGGRIAKVDSSGGYTGNYYPPSQAISQRVHCSGEDLYSAGDVSSTYLQSLIKYRNDTLKYTFTLGEVETGCLHKNGYDVFVGCNTDEQFAKGIIMKISEAEATSITEQDNSSLLSLYPNPSQSVFSINYTSAEKDDLFLNVISSKGQLIYTEHISKFVGEYKKELDLGKYSKGIYNVELVHGKEKMVKRVVLN